MTNESALLGLIAEMQIKVYALQAENAQLRERLAETDSGGVGDLVSRQRGGLGSTPGDPSAVLEH